jgi:DNA polymerase V
MAAIHIKTPLDLKRGDPRVIRERLGVVTMRLALELRGVPCLDLERDIPDRKSIMASRSFGRPVTTLAELREAVASYTARAAEKLRRQHLATAHLMVFVETNRFKPDEAQHCATRAIHLPVATSDSGKLIVAALSGLASIWRDGHRYKKAGVVLLYLHPASAVQEGLFDKTDNPRRGTLMRTIDRLNLRFGRDTVSFAAAECRRPWKLRRECRPATRPRGMSCCGFRAQSHAVDREAGRRRMAVDLTKRVEEPRFRAEALRCQIRKSRYSKPRPARSPIC